MLKVKLATIAHVFIFFLCYSTCPTAFTRDERKPEVIDDVCINSESVDSKNKRMSDGGEDDEGSEEEQEQIEEEDHDEWDDGDDQENDQINYNWYVLHPCVDMENECEIWASQGQVRS